MCLKTCPVPHVQVAHVDRPSNVLTILNGARIKSHDQLSITGKNQLKHVPLFISKWSPMLPVRTHAIPEA